jgi:3-hydroxyisobutyrate dehydrogenase-like beta-hydroxyacid dehydrogenase
MDVGVIGLGKMGAGIARRLLQAGHRVTVYNRTRSRADALKADGAEVAETPAAASGGAATFTMLADDAAVEAMTLGADGVLAHLPEAAVHISMSTITVALAERLAEAHRAAGRGFVSAPVFGRPDAAAAGKLYIVAAGEASAIDQCRPLFEAIGQRSFVVGEAPAAANLVKLGGNYLIAATIQSLGEAIALMRKSGVDPGAFIEVVTNSLFAAPVYRTYGALIVDQRYEPAGFAMPLGLKDMRAALAAADAKGVAMPLASLLRDQFLGALGRGGAGLDWSALAQETARNAGL